MNTPTPQELRTHLQKTEPEPFLLTIPCLLSDEAKIELFDSIPGKYLEGILDWDFNDMEIWFYLDHEDAGLEEFLTQEIKQLKPCNKSKH